MFKVNNRNTRTRCEICSKLTIKIPERRLACCSSVSIVNFEQVNAGYLILQGNQSKMNASTIFGYISMSEKAKTVV